MPGKQRFGYLMGVIPSTLFIGFFNFAYTRFFFDDLKMNPTYWFIALLIYAFINALNDPIIGYLSDNTNVEKWGSRRIIYIKFGAPFLSLAFILIWWIPTDHGSQILLFLHFLITICFYDTMMTMVVMTWMALLPDMTMDIDERTKTNFISTIIVLIFGFPLLVISTLDHEQLKNISLIIGIIGFICYMFVVKLSKEKPEHQHDEPVPIKEAIKLTLNNKAHLCVIGFNFLNQLSSSMGSSFMFIYWYILGEQNLIWYFLIVFVIGYGSNVIAISIREKFGMFNLMIKFGIAQVIFGLLTFFIILDPARESFIWIGLILNSIFGGATVFRGVLHMIVIDEDEVKSGQRREGMYFGVNAMLIKPAESFGPMIGSALLLAFGYIQGGEAMIQPQDVFLGIKILYFLIPQIVNIFILILIKIFPLQGENLSKMQLELDELHIKKRDLLKKRD